MSVLLVHNTLHELKQVVPAGTDIQICEKRSNFNYKIIGKYEGYISPEIKEAFFGAIVNVTLLPIHRAFVLWFPTGESFFKELVTAVNPDCDEIVAFVLPGLNGVRLVRIEGQIVATFRNDFVALPWSQIYATKKNISFYVAEYKIGYDDVLDSKLRRIPEFESLKSMSVNDFHLECSSYHLVIASDPSSNDNFKSVLTQPDLVNLEFKEYRINGHPDKGCFLSKELNAAEIIQLVKTSHPSTRFCEICVLKTKKADKTDYSKFSLAMKADFKHEDRIFAPFEEFVKFIAEIGKDLIFARLFHLAQSSGTGKTKLCLHLIKKLKKGIYSVYRENGSKGYPHTTDWTMVLIDLFKKCRSESEAATLCLSFILASVQTFHTIDFDVMEFYATDAKVYNAKFKDNFNTTLLLTESELVAEIGALASGIGSCFPIILDECSEFLCYSNDRSRNDITLYRAFRRAMKEIKSHKIVVICLGTKPSLNDVVLNYRMDSSARPEAAILPIAPYIFVHSFDVFVEPGDDDAALLPFSSHFDSSTARNMIPTKLKQFALKCGRPLWNAYDTYDSALYAGLVKLAADHEIAMMTAFVLRTGAPVVPSCMLAHKMVLSGMATLEYVDVYGESCYVSYSPEPVLANASRLYCGSLNGLKIVLNQFKEYVDKRYVLDTGSAGEFIARVILLRVVDSLMESSSGPSRAELPFFNAPDSEWIQNIAAGRLNTLPSPGISFPGYCVVTLRSFLQKLCPLNEHGIQQLGLSEEMLGGLVNLSQFIATKRPFDVDQNVLKQGFLRGVGFNLPTNFPGADIMIPVFRTDGLFSPIMIQVKNLEQHSIPGENTDIIGKLTAEYMGITNCLAAVSNQEFAKIVIQFAPCGKKPSEDLFKICKCLPKAGMGNILWILGLDGFKHLFSSSVIEIEDPETGSAPGSSRTGRKRARPLPIVYKVVADPINELFESLGLILDNARDFVDSLDFNNVRPITASQTTREGLRNTLNTHLPLKTSHFFGLE